MTRSSHAPSPETHPDPRKARTRNTMFDNDDHDHENEASTHPRLVSDIKDYLLTHGHLLKLVRFETPSRVRAVGVNVSCHPTSFPRYLFNHAKSLQPSMNELYVRASQDETWLYNVLKSEIESDPMGLVASLWDVWVKCREAGTVQRVACGIVRSDYMLHNTDDEDAVSLKQVEMNTFSVAGACHAEGVASMHRWLMRRRIAEMDDADTSIQPQLGDLPSNANTSSIVASLSAAHNIYQRQFPNGRSKCILMIVQPENFNIADERPIEYRLFACYRCEWRDVLTRTHLGPDRELLFQPSGSGKGKMFEVSVVYYRAGYDAEEYSEEIGGRGIRLMLELSRAIKCPDVKMHLVGMKSVQCALAAPGVLEQLSPDSRHVDEVKETFVEMHALDSSSTGLEVRKWATNPETAMSLVLKPDLEGGGHNIFGKDIPTYLSDIPEMKWHRYTLMRLITPPAGIDPGMLLTSEEVYEGPVVSEVGVLGFAMWRAPLQGSEPEILKNEAIGWTFKTKPKGVDEMSVVKGYGCFDCPLLT
ncbi:hypothetical protein LTR17_018648 [Elasticomyces elasticus]|nr:hypothetical protein LTR17_018648 [Elasticomyces elasticus]